MQREGGISWIENYHAIASLENQMKFHLVFYTAVSVSTAKQFLFNLIQVELQDLPSVTYSGNEVGLYTDGPYIISISRLLKVNLKD